MGEARRVTCALDHLTRHVQTRGHGLSSAERYGSIHGPVDDQRWGLDGSKHRGDVVTGYEGVERLDQIDELGQAPFGDPKSSSRPELLVQTRPDDFVGDHVAKRGAEALGEPDGS